MVNDQSTDRTADIVRGLLPEIPHLRLLETEDVPANWVGKNNAVWLGARQAKSSWLLFTDADAELGAGAVARALAIAEETGASLVSFSPEQVTKTWYEKALIPFVYCRLAKYFSFDAVNDPASSVAAANGQFLMMRRDAYDAIGGHASVAGRSSGGCRAGASRESRRSADLVRFRQGICARPDVPVVRRDV